MTSHVNQVIAVTIRGDVDMEFVSQEKSIIGISKDLTEEPNEAELEIYNLKDETRAAIKAAADVSTPIEIAVSALHSSDPIRTYVGEIEHVVNRPLRPGYATRIRALSQKRSHRAAYISEKTYVASTPIADIAQELIDAINMPVHASTFPSTGILLAQSFTGPAFPLLQRVCSDIGRFAWIDDGVIYISSVYDPPDPTVIEITDAMLITEPQESTRDDARDTVLHTVTEMTAVDPLRKKRRRQKRTVEKKEPGANDYAEIEVIDVTVPGIELECFAIPNIAPDHLVTLDGGDTYYRVFETELYGDDLRGGERPTTRIRADRFEDGL